MPPEIALAAVARPDGIIGPKTLEALRNPGVLDKFLCIRSDRYVSNKNFDAFGKGWMRRLLKITIACTQLQSTGDKDVS